MKIQCSIAGYSGQPITLLGLIDNETGVLVVAKAIAFAEHKTAKDFTLISNLELDECDFRFTEDHFRDSIREFFNGKAQGTIDILEELARYNPENRIERQGVDANGPKYAVSQDVDCGQIAVLAMTCYWKKQQSIGSAIDAAKELADFYGVQTI